MPWLGPAPSMPSARGCCGNMPKRSGSCPVSPSMTARIRPTLINLVRHDLGFSKTDKRFPAKGTCLAIYSRAVNGEQPLEEVLGSYFPWCAMWQAELQALFARYVETKQQQHVLDYDDLLLYWAHMMQEAALAEDIGARFDHVLVDEYQDTNRLQASVLLALRPNGKGLTVVGDDAQSIYSFRAATVRNILDFPGHFTPRAEVVTLEQNYRSTQPILAAANAVIELAEERFTKNLWSDRTSIERPHLVSVRDEAAQARYVVEKVLENREQGLRSRRRPCCSAPRTIQRPARSRTDPPQHSVREIRRPEIPGGRAYQGSARLPALGREPARPGGGFPRRAVAAGRGSRHRRAGVGPSARASRSGRGPAAISSRRRPRPSIGRISSKRFALVRGRAAGWPAELDLVRRWYEPHLQRIHDDAMLRAGRPRCSSRRSPRPIRAASGSSPSSRSIRPRPPAIEPASRCSTRTI